MRKTRDLLNPGGMMLLQTIGGNRSVGQGDPWISRYIFPNSMLPSIRHIAQASEDTYVMEDWHNFGADYDRTIMQWVANFDDAWDSLSDPGRTNYGKSSSPPGVSTVATFPFADADAIFALMNRYMKAAVEEARYGVEAGDGGPFGAVIVLDGEIVGRGHNTVVTTNDPTAHAEVNAIREAAIALGRFDLSDCTLYTTCEPCPMCYSAVYWARIPVVYRGATQEDAAAIGFDDKEIYEDLARAPEKRKIPMVEVDREACLEPFRIWEAKPDRALY